MPLVLGFLTCISLIFAALTMVNMLFNMHRVDAIMLVEEIHERLPLGSSLPLVESFLEKHSLQFSYEPSFRTLYVIIREVKGSSFLIRKDATFHFHFTKYYKLGFIETKTVLIGP